MTSPRRIRHTTKKRTNLRGGVVFEKRAAPFYKYNECRECRIVCKSRCVFAYGESGKVSKMSKKKLIAGKLLNCCNFTRS